MADAGEEHAQIVVDLCGRADGRARIARVDLLLDGYGWRKARDPVALRLRHAPEKLPGVSRETLHIAALTLGIKCVEGQR